MISSAGLFALQWQHRCEPGALCAQQPMQPQLIKQDLLVSCFPERADLLGLASKRKGLPLCSQHNELFEMVGGGISAAGLPFRYGTPGDM